MVLLELHLAEFGIVLFLEYFPLLLEFNLIGLDLDELLNSLPLLKLINHFNLLLSSHIFVTSLIGLEFEKIEFILIQYLLLFLQHSVFLESNPLSLKFNLSSLFSHFLECCVQMVGGWEGVLPWK
jgi:hypothetical protein